MCLAFFDFQKSTVVTLDGNIMILIACLTFAPSPIGSHWSRLVHFPCEVESCHSVRLLSTAAKHPPHTRLRYISDQQCPSVSAKPQPACEEMN